MGVKTEDCITGIPVCDIRSGTDLVCRKTVKLLKSFKNQIFLHSWLIYLIKKEVLENIANLPYMANEI